MTAAKPRSVQGLEERHTEAKAVRMRYFVGGEGPPLVLVHGLSGAATNWSQLAPLLARRHRLLVPDLPGHGGSAALPAAPNLSAYAERVRVLMEREGMPSASVVGHSMGAVVALRLAVVHPRSVEALVLAGAAGIASSTRAAEVVLSALTLLRPSKLVAPLRTAVAERRVFRHAVFGRIEVADALSLTVDAVEGLLGSASLHTDIASAGSALVRDDPRLDLERVECPCLVLWGARSLRAIADCGHLLIAERPEACAAAIEDFLAGI